VLLDAGNSDGEMALAHADRRSGAAELPGMFGERVGIGEK